MSGNDHVRVLRIVEYEGPRTLVENIVERSIHGLKVIETSEGKLNIRAGTIGGYPEILESAT